MSRLSRPKVATVRGSVRTTMMGRTSALSPAVIAAAMKA
jgi:hypothetical protein